MSNIIGDVVDGIKDRLKEKKAEEAKRNILLKYHPELIEKTNYSAKEFYALVLKNVAERQIPDNAMEHIMIRQGGPGTARRLYLQLRRSRMFIEICAMPFGTGFFVAERVFERRPHGPLLALVIGLLVVGGISTMVWQNFGFLAGVLTFAGIIAAIWSVMRMAAANMAQALDQALGDLPLIGDFYESIFHPDTYYRQDTDAAYREAVHKAFGEAVADIKGEKGIKARGGMDGAPVVRDLHRRGEE